MSASPWLVSMTTTQTAEHRWICFPPAGGSVTYFRQLAAATDARVELLGVQLPGRERRLREEPVQQLSQVGDALSVALRGLPDLPTTLVGACSGAALAWSAAEEISHSAELKGLAVFGGPPPQDPDLAKLPELATAEIDADLVHFLATLGVPEQVLASPALLRLVLPPILADFELVTQAASQPVYQLPAIGVFTGRDDAFSRDRLLGWKQHCFRFEQRELPGGHHLLVERAAESADELLGWAAKL